METDRDGEEDEEEEKKRGDGIERSVYRVVYGVTLCVELTLSLFSPSSLFSPPLSPLFYIFRCV